MPTVLGVGIHSEEARTPRSEHILRIIRNAEDERLKDRERVDKHDDEIAEVKSDVAEIKAAIKAGNNRTLVQVAAIGLISAVTVAIIGYWGQLKSIELGAKQGKEAGVLVVQSAQPSTESTYLAGYHDGAKATVDEQLRRLKENPPPIASTPDRVASARRTR
jgi:hypothetical protein